MAAIALPLTACDLFDDQPAGIAYTASIEGVPDGDLKQAMAQSSELMAGSDRPPANTSALRARSEGDAGRLTKAMASRGYYDGKVTAEIDTSANPATVTLVAEPGEVYRLARLAIEQADGTPPPLADRLTAGTLGIALDQPGLAKPILDAQAKILKMLTTGGYPLAKVDPPATVIDTATHTMRVTYTVHPGAAAWFGETSVTGLHDLDPAFVLNRLKWFAGVPYDSTPVDKTAELLVGTGLFSTVDVHPGPEVLDNGEIPMVVDAAERDKHSVGASAEYSTSQQVLANVFWEDRNLFGYAEKLRLSGVVGNQEKNAIATFTRPDMFEVNQSLTSTLGFSDETVDPYTSRKEFAGSSLERPLATHVTGSAGFLVTHANLSTDMGGEHYDLLGLPLSVKFDNSNDLLNPVEGFRTSLLVTPAIGSSGQSLHFVTAEARVSAYQTLDPANHLVTAEFMRLGTIDGVSFEALPRDLRFYSGGGGSLRGYAYQHAGPLDFAQEPAGGKSVFETGAELRIPVWKDISVVPFAEAGSYYEKPVPELTHTLLYDAGIGLRYNTAIGPLRLDVATPLRRRSSDGVIQIYASIGQAF